MTLSKSLGLSLVAVLFVGTALLKAAPFRATDPGVRGGPASSGDPLPGIVGNQLHYFEDGKEDFNEAEGVGDGLGPTYNLDSCGGCHAQPAVGGSSPFENPQVALATAFGARNAVPSFITLNGPVREVRFPLNADGTPDGGVHALFTVRGRSDSTGDASDCTTRQERFEREVARGNITFRIPTPVFGAGLMEMIPDAEIRSNLARNNRLGQGLGISGVTNHNGNDGTIARFGWKAQNKSLLLFSAEAYNVEMGISNEIFQNERDETGSCQYAQVPNDVTDTESGPGMGEPSAIEKFAFFMRFLAPPTPAADTPSIVRGRNLFASTGCALCHTPTLHTGDTTVAALRNKTVNLYSDLAVHGMGPGLADNVSQGQAAGDEFRTAPLWGLGQRIFFLHDGRADDLLQAISAHKSQGDGNFGASEANGVVDKFNDLNELKKQDLLNFLRSL